MRKAILGTLIVIAVILSMVAIKITANVSTPLDGFFTRNRRDETYDHIYIQSSEEQQAALDLLLAEAIQNASLNTLSVEDAVDTVIDLKQSVADTFDYDYGYYGGMMGGNSRPNCHQINGVYESFEWVYLHSSPSQQREMMVLLVTDLQALDLESLTLDELVISLKQIKIQVINALNG